MTDPTQMTGVTKYIGVPRKRSEDPALLMGQAKYVDDIRLPGMVEVAFLRSTHSHARIKGLDLGEARAHPDCIDIVTADEFGGSVTTAPVPSGSMIAPGVPCRSRAPA